MKTGAASVFAVVAIVLGGCAAVPQVPVALDQHALGAESGRMGVAMAPIPRVDTAFPGAGCLLCMATASVANASLTTHARTLPLEDLPNLKNDIADLLRKKGNDVTVIEEEVDLKKLSNLSSKGPNIAKKDFSPLQQKYHIDKLLVIEITSIGFVRDYSAYIPTSDPRSVLEGAGYIVNLKDHVYEWYVPVKIIKNAEQNWDEPPKFPGLTNAYFQSLETGKDSFLAPFKN